MATDAVVVGSGPNGLTAAIRLAEAGWSVLVVEANDTPGGGARTAELTLPGFRHDVCSATHPLGAASPAFASMPLAEHGLRWLHGDIELAHPLDDGSSGVLLRDMHATDAANDAGGRWSRLLAPLVEDWPSFVQHVMGPPIASLRHPVVLTRFGVRALVPGATVSERVLGGGKAGAAFLGSAAHAGTSLTRPLSAAAGLAFAAAAHTGGWPIAEGGSQAITDALITYLRSLGGRVECGRPVRARGDLPPARAYLFDTTPWQVVEIAGDRLPARQVRRWRRFRHGAAAFKVDYALDGPVPWIAEAARRAPTVHLGGTAAEIVAAEADVWRGRVPRRPFVLAGQQSIVDTTRAPAGKHTLWTYGHLPFGSTADLTDAIEGQLDRFAPGWRDVVLARHVTSAAGLAGHNPNYRGGDIGGGASDGFQVLFRPAPAIDPYRTAAPDIWICSSSTPPGVGVHGLCGHHAARSVLRSLG